MRKLLTAVLLVASAGLVACGGDGGGGSNNPGGSGGGIGGSGGTGGDGGTGGTGGTEAVCGNGEIEQGETCDDGNEWSGDGCSENCIAEGTSCESPLNFNFLGQLDANTNVRVLEATMEGTDSAYQASCGGDGPEAFYSFTSSHNGTLMYQVLPANGAFVSVLGECGGAELGCQANQAIGTMQIAKEQTIIFVVDTAKVVQSVEYALVARVVPVFEEGDTCPAANLDPAVHGACGDGLRCAVVNFQNKCVVNNPPVLETVSASRFGTDFVLEAQGGDEDGDVLGAALTFIDGDGQPIVIQAIGTTEGFLPFNPAVTGQTTFTATINAAGFFALYPELLAAESLDVGLYDSGNSVSAKQTITLTLPPLVGEGESCDPAGIENRCDAGQICDDPGTGAVCATLNTLRLNACGAATVQAGAGTVTGSVVGGTRSLWEPPTSCLEFPYEGGVPDGVVKITLDSAVARLVISSESENTALDTILYVYEGCGENAGAPLACNDDIDTEGQNFASTVELTDVAAGEYLVIVDSWPAQDGSTGGAYELTVTVE